MNPNTKLPRQVGPVERRAILDALAEEIPISETNPEYLEYLVEAVWQNVLQIEEMCP